MTIPVLSIRQPWATLTVLQEKLIETRAWATTYRGPVLLHASSARCAGISSPEIARALSRHGYMAPDDLPRGCILGRAVLMRIDRIGMVRLTAGDVVPMIPDGVPLAYRVVPELERALGRYERNRYAWTFERVEMFETPIDVAGRDGLWTPDATLLAAVEAAR